MKRIVDPDLARDVSAIAAATGLVGVSFGAIALAAGISPWLTVAMSMLVFAAASQFTAVAVIASGGSLVAAVLAGLLLNVRHILLGLAAGEQLGRSWAGRLIGSHLLVDESVAFTLAQSDPRRRRLAFWTTGLSLFVAWNVGVIVGALAATAATGGCRGSGGGTRHHPAGAGRPAGATRPAGAAGGAPAIPASSHRGGFGRLSRAARHVPDRQEDPVTLVSILLFAGGTYALRLAGPVLYNRIDVSDRTRRWLTLPTVALLAALAATATLLPGGEFDSVARVVGVAVGIVAALRRLPFVVVVLLAAGTTAVLRQLGLT